MTAPVAPAPTRQSRDGYLDALRAGSLLVVVLWHLLATKLTWTATGPHATNPLGSVPGLWLGTWVLQVMPVFFYIGGYLHRRSSRPGYLRYRLVGLFAMAAPLLVAWVIVGGVLALAAGSDFADGTVLFALSPLWFLAVYVMLVATLPLWLRLHDRLGLAALPLLAGAAAAVDVLRFGLGIGWLGWVNLVLVWGLAHQAGFHHDALMRAPRRTGYALLAAGLTVLCGLLALGYPGAMVGVPGEKWSNMSPPTVAIVALTAVQLGLIRLGYPTLPNLLRRRPAARVLRLANRYGMPVFLLHMSVLLLAQAVGWPVTGIVLVAVLGLVYLRRANVTRADAVRR
jgi:peptidoglycan/LPS O-acetylase OafA/YrhL